MNRRNLLRTGANLMAFSAVVLNAVPLHAETNAVPKDWQREFASLLREIDRARYDMSAREAQEAGFKALLNRTDALVKEFPKRAEPLVMRAFALQAHASIMGRGLGAMRTGAQAVEKLEEAIAIDPNVFAVSTYTLLGSLYLAPAEVMPNFTGHKKSARTHLQKALALDAHGAEQNLGYAQLLVLEKNYGEALKYANAALQAPPRSDRGKADADVRRRAQAVIEQAKVELN